MRLKKTIISACACAVLVAMMPAPALADEGEGLCQRQAKTLAEWLQQILTCG